MTSAFLLAALLAGPARSQTLPLPSLEAPAAAVQAVDAGQAPALPETALGPARGELVEPLALPVDSLSSSGKPAPARLVEKTRTIVRAVRSAALASMISAGAALGLSNCQGPAPLTYDAGSPYPAAYLTYPNGHPLAVSPPTTENTVPEDDLIGAINSYRLGAGVSVVVPVPPLGDMARANSVHMPLHGYFSSENPEGDGPAQRAAKVGVPQASIGEAIAQQAPDGGGDAASVLQGWLADPAKAAMLSNPYFNGIGVGYFADPKNGPYWTADLIDSPGLDDGGLGYNPNYDAGPAPDLDASYVPPDAGVWVPPDGGEDAGE